jgi:uncharacterized protein (TIRG00374 family)
MINKKRILLVLKIVVSISLIVYIINKIEWGKAFENFEQANYLIISLVFFLNLLERIELTYKWKVLIEARGKSIGFFRLLLINSIGGFLGLFLPSSVGTDVVRGYYLVKNNAEKSVSVSSVFVDRILSMFALLAFGIFFVFLAGDEVSKYKLNIYLPILFILLIILFYIFQKEKTAEILKNILQKSKFKKISGYISKLHFAILEYKKHPNTLVVSFVLNIVVQINRVLTYYVISLAFGFSIPVIYFFLYVPVIMLVLTIPVSIGGLGVREATFITFFSAVGLSVNDAIVITFTNTFIDTINTCFGGLAYMIFNSRHKNELNKTNINDQSLVNDREIIFPQNEYTIKFKYQ